MESTPRWDPRMIFAINSFGHLAFSYAKLINVICDLVIGNGAEVLAALLLHLGVRKDL